MPTTTPTPQLLALIVQRNSPLLEQECALCHRLFDVGDRVVICPMDSTRHHSHCWESNGNHCVAYACTGAGFVYSEQLSQVWDEQEREAESQAVVVTSQEAYGFYAEDEPIKQEDDAGWQTGRVPGGGRYAVYQSRNKGCNWGCWLSCLLLSLLVCAVFAAGTWVFFEAVMGWVQGLLG
jgi:hypothetical protein